MGGSVGLKGTDGDETLREAVARGAQKVSPARTVAALVEMKKRRMNLQFLTADGEMGRDELTEAGLEATVVDKPSSPSSRDDTARTAMLLAEEGVDLLLFAGGDGTARDIVGMIDARAPILGIPAGVKMHSSVFALTPQKAADAVEAFEKHRRVRDGEVMDVDEVGVRSGVVRAKLFGVAKIPDDSSSIQSTKDAYHSGDADDEAEELGAYLAENMASDTYYVLGPGTTTAAVAKHLGVEKTILGVDAYLNRSIVLRDASEKDLLGLLGTGRPAKIFVSPIGAQGFFFGRGNQQISPDVIRLVGADNVIVIATPTKLAATAELRVDTGDPDLDAAFRGRIKVVTGYGRRRLVGVT